MCACVHYHMISPSCHVTTWLHAKNNNSVQIEFGFMILLCFVRHLCVYEFFECKSFLSSDFARDFPVAACLIFVLDTITAKMPLSYQIMPKMLLECRDLFVLANLQTPTPSVSLSLSLCLCLCLCLSPSLPLSLSPPPFLSLSLSLPSVA